MSKILSTLAILCLFIIARTDTTTSQSASISSLYSDAVQVFFGTNTTEWVSTKPWYTVTSGNNQNVKFGPSATTNETIYAYGIISSGTSISGVVRRELNATIIADVITTPVEGAVISDTSVTATIPVTGVTSSYYLTAVGPGYLAILSTGTSTNIIVQVTLISTSATASTPVTASTSSSTTSSVTLGNIWYDIGSGTFFFTYATTTATPTTSVYLGGIVASTGALYWTAPGLTVLSASADTINYIVSGPNNWMNSTEIIVAYKDTSATTPTTYFTEVTKSSSTSSVTTPGTLVADTITGTTLAYIPIGVWASEYTYGITTSLYTSETTYSIENFFNGSTTNTKDSGLPNSTSAAATKVLGWPLTTGYTLLAEYAGTTTDTFPTITSYLGTFFANGSANTTESTLFTSLAGPFNVFVDINGTAWIGWTDLDETETNVYNLYVARLQGQIYSSTSSGNALTTLMAFVAFCLVAVFAF